MPWAIEGYSKNRLDGEKRFFFGKYNCPNIREGIEKIPSSMNGHTLLLFNTRKEARKFIKENYSFIRTRKDLRKEPHGWRMPKPVKVNVRYGKEI